MHKDNHRGKGNALGRIMKRIKAGPSAGGAKVNRLSEVLFDSLMRDEVPACSTFGEGLVIHQQTYKKIDTPAAAIIDYICGRSFTDRAGILRSTADSAATTSANPQLTATGTNSTADAAHQVEQNVFGAEIAIELQGGGGGEGTLTFAGDGPAGSTLDNTIVFGYPPGGDRGVRVDMLLFWGADLENERVYQPGTLRPVDPLGTVAAARILDFAFTNIPNNTRVTVKGLNWGHPYVSGLVEWVSELSAARLLSQL